MKTSSVLYVRGVLFLGPGDFLVLRVLSPRNFIHVGSTRVPEDPYREDSYPGTSHVREDPYL